MQCPLCREQVADENQLQVHYLLNCTGYVEEQPQGSSFSINKPNQAVQFRWAKVKPTLAREVFLISSLAGSINLTWNEVEECFLSEAADVPKGLHICQLVVDGDPMSTENFEISDHSKLVNITISEASLAEGSTSGNVSSNESHNVRPPAVDSSSQTRRTQERTVETRTTLTGNRPSQKGALYQELVKHQILHGDSFDEIAGNLQPNEGRRPASGRTRVNGRHITNNSGDFQQFLRSSQTSDDQRDAAVNEESEGDNGNLDPFENGERVEERVSSVSGGDSVELSHSLSSHEDFEIGRRPSLLGSDTRNDGQDMEFDSNGARDFDGARDGARVVHDGDGNQVESVRAFGLGETSDVHGDLEENPEPFIHGENLGTSDHEEFSSDGDGQHHEVPHDHDLEEQPDGHDHEEQPDGHDHEEPPAGHDYVLPDGQHYEDVPDDDNHEEPPDGHDDIDLEISPDDHSHEFRPDDQDQEETLNTDDHRQVMHVQDPNLATHRDPSTPDAHTERTGNLLPVLDARNRVFVMEDNQHLLQQSKREPSQDMTSRSRRFRPSSAPTFSSYDTREPEGGNEDMSGYNTGRIKNVTPSAPDSTLWQSSDRTGARASGTAGISQRGGRHTLLDDQQLDTLVRHSPPGSVFGDQEIRRPPLYTSAPSRPMSSPLYPTQDRSVISPLVSPLVSPRNGEITTATRLAPSGGSFRESNRAARTQESSATSGLLDRQTPMGSAHIVGTSPVDSSSHQSTTTADVWSDEKIKELLDSLKQPLRRKNGHSTESSVSLRESQESSVVTALKTRLTEREEYIKKLKTRSNAYEKEIVKIRAKEMELAKALSLAETGQAAAKEQEDIVRQLTHALNTKEGKCSDLEKKVQDMKQENRLRELEMESRKKVHEMRDEELKSVNISLRDEVKTLRQDSLQYSPILTNKYKKLQEDFLESRAVNDSLQDQVKLLEKDKLELQKKLRRISTEMEESKATNTSSSPRTKHYSSAVDEALRNPHDHYTRSTAEAKISQRDTTVVGNYDFPWGSRNGQTQITDYRSKIPGTDRGEVRVERHDGGNTSSQRSRFELESYPASSSGWRRKMSSGDVASSEDTRIDVGRYLSTRSYSSDSIVAPSLLQNGFSENVRNHDKATKHSRERSTRGVGDDYRKLERRRRERPHSYHSGSREDLTAPSSTVPKSWPSPQSTQFSVRGRHLDVSATSDTSDVTQSTPSPRKGKPFAPNTPQEIDHGMTVLVTRACGKISRGAVKYIGCLPAKNDVVFLGLELEKEDGKHDGQFQGDRFFICKKNHGIFVPFNKVVMAYT